MLQIYNTLSGRKEPFEPLDPGEVKMYVCGPTVYGAAHMGHALSYIVFDVVRRYLEYRGYRVRHVQNFTDVDDKIIARAQEAGVSWKELSDRYAEEFLMDMDALNVERADSYPRASETIPAIIEDISRLVECGHAYELEGDVYFRVLSDLDYGKLSGRRLEEMNAGARVELDERKEHPMDFALWKAAKPGEPAWDSPWGQGRPGWHIECTSMSTRELGPQLDIHGGGNDLIFPHHENEIAQSEAVTGKQPFARYWMHNGWLTLNKQKMARSEGNVLPVPAIVEKYGADAFRWFVLSSHYTRPLSYSEEAMSSAAKSVDRLVQAAALRTSEATDGDVESHTAFAEPAVAEYDGLRDEFEAAMDDDFNTSRAVAVLVKLSKEVNRLRVAGESEVEALALLRELAGVLGFTLVGPRSTGEGSHTTADISAYIELLVAVRNELRAVKQWKLSDRVRDGLRELGVTLEDTAEGTKWRVDR